MEKGPGGALFSFFLPVGLADFIADGTLEQVPPARQQGKVAHPEN